MVVVAVVSTSVILLSYHLHRRLEADLRVRILGGEGGAGAEDQDHDRRRLRRRPRRPRDAKKKKVRFADDVAEPSSNSEEYRRRARSSSTYGGQPRAS